MESRPLSIAMALAWSLATASLLLVVGLILVSLRPAAATDVVSLGAVEALAFVTITAAVLRAHRVSRPLRDAIGVRSTHPMLVMTGLLLGVVLRGPAESLRAVVEQLAPTSDAELARRALLLDVGNTRALVTLLLALACVAPLVEEVLLRGVLFGGLVRRYGAGRAVVWSALCFGLVHLWDWRSLPALVLVGVVLGYLRAASGSLLPCVTLHVAYNASTVIALTTGLASATRPLQFGNFVNGIAWLVVGALLFLAQSIARSSPEAAAARAEDAR